MAKAKKTISPKPGADKSDEKLAIKDRFADTFMVIKKIKRKRSETKAKKVSSNAMP